MSKSLIFSGGTHTHESTLRNEPHSTHIKWPPMSLSFLACEVGVAEQARLYVNAE